MRISEESRCGRSLGAGMAALAAVAFPAPTLVISPWESLIHVARDFARGFAPLRLLKKFFRHEVKAGEAAVQATSPIRCLVFTRDSLISNDRSRAFFLAWAGDKTWVELNGEHADQINLSPTDAGFLLGTLDSGCRSTSQISGSGGEIATAADMRQCAPAYGTGAIVEAS